MVESDGEGKILYVYRTEPSFIELGLQFGLYFFILWVGISMAAMEASDWPR